MTTPFDLERFIASPTLEELTNLTKANLLTVAQHYKLSATEAMSKAQIKKLVVQYFQDEELLSESSELLETGAMTGEELLQLRRLEFQEKEREREAQLKLKELEFKEKELATQLKMKELELRSAGPVDTGVTERAEALTFDVSKHIRFVPTFSETEVDKYFLHFEKVACSLKWPKESWTLLLQSTLVGKAREAYSALSIEESCQYELVKAAVLKAYELVPEAYRQKFRNSAKREGQTYVEFARDKETLFNRWCTSKEISGNFEKLRQLLLIEEFKKCLPGEVKTYLDEKKVETLSQAGVLADDYILTHKSASQRGQLPSHLNSNAECFRPSHSFGGQHQHKGNTGNSSGNSRPRPNQNLPSGPRCYHCRKKGHVMADCWYLKGATQGSTKPTMMTVKACGSVIQKVTASDSGCPDVPQEYKPFLSYGSICLPNSNIETPIMILRDTGANQSLLLEGSLPLSEQTSTGIDVLIQGVAVEPLRVPLHRVQLKSDLVSGIVTVGVRPSLPVVGVQLILGNDLAGGKVSADPYVTSSPECHDEVSEDAKIYPACAVTRAMTKAKEQTDAADLSPEGLRSFDDYPNTRSDTKEKLTKLDGADPLLNLSDTFMSHHADVVDIDDKDCTPFPVPQDGEASGDSTPRINLIALQEGDPTLTKILNNVMSESEAAQVAVCYYKLNGVLMRKWRPLDASPNESWRVVNQIVVPEQYRSEILHLAHEAPMAGHLGINKTYQKILQNFYWPGLKRDVKSFCQSCHACQLVGKPNQNSPLAPLKPIPAFSEPFSQVIIDCVGPLPKTKAGHQYLLTIMCASTRFPEAIPLKNIRANTIVKHLTKFFTLVGLPKTVQSDQGSNFLAGIFQQVMHELGIKQNLSSAYHPQSQGALERFHQTLKNMIRTYCYEEQKEWDEGIPMLLFAVRESVQQSLGFSPFELLYGREVRGPLKVLKEHWLTEDESNNLLDQVAKLRYRMTKARELAKRNLEESQATMKVWYDKRAKKRSFKVGDEVLALLPTPGNSLQARYSGPFVVDKKLNEVDYIINTPERRKQQRLCHINMLKLYRKRKEAPKHTLMVAHVVEGEREVVTNGPRLSNSMILKNLQCKLDHLSSEEQADMKQLLLKFHKVFGDVPSVTTCSYHDVDVGRVAPIRQHPYRINPIKLEQMRKEVDYMLQHHIIEPSDSDWSSPCVLVPKSDGTFRFCTDFRKLNALTKTDSFPLPRIDDCIDRIGKAKYVTKLDLLKGYWQIPLTNQAKRLSAFVTPDGLYQYRVMPFGMKNAPATFQRMINQLVGRIEGCEAYIDDVVIYSNDWKTHLERVHKVLTRFAEANLTVNLAKSEFGHAEIVFLGHAVGNGLVKPLDAKVQSIVEYPAPTTKKELMRFLGMVGYYRRFCKNFSTITASLTNLLRKDQDYVWTTCCQDAFVKVKSLLLSNPVLIAPDFQRQFILMVDASDLGAGAVLMQCDSKGVDHPICYFSRKFNLHQKNYSTIEKETLALVLALQHFDVYLNTTKHPIIVYTDHNPLTFISKMKNHNQRLLRWGLLLQGYPLDIRHVRGKENVVADALSRMDVCRTAN